MGGCYTTQCQEKEGVKNKKTGKQAGSQAVGLCVTVVSEPMHRRCRSPPSRGIAHDEGGHPVRGATSASNAVLHQTRPCTTHNSAQRACQCKADVWKLFVKEKRKKTSAADTCSLSTALDGVVVLLNAGGTDGDPSVLEEKLGVHVAQHLAVALRLDDLRGADAPTPMYVSCSGTFGASS